MSFAMWRIINFENKNTIAVSNIYKLSYIKHPSCETCIDFTSCYDSMNNAAVVPTKLKNDSS